MNDVTPYSMKCVAPTAAEVLGLNRPAAATEPAIKAITDDLRGSRSLAILAPDALGLFPWRRWRERMPYLSSLHARCSIVLESVMPSITPDNFSCMLTGVDRTVHGIQKPYCRDDGTWVEFQCETLYDVVRKAGGVSVGAGQRGYTGEMLLARCADQGWVAKAGPSSHLSDLIMEKMPAEPPMFLIAQFGNVDTVFHALGPSNPEVGPMLQALDRSLSELVPFLTGRGMSVILLADHGQHDVPDPPEGAKRGKHGEDRPEDRLVPCTWLRAT